MNIICKTVVKRYFALLFFLSFFCIALSPYIIHNKCDSIIKTIYSLFVYRFTTVSMISLLFATITTIQKYEKQRVCVALSMSGISSWKIMQTSLYFSIVLCFCSLFVNQYLYKGSLVYLKKDKQLSSNKYELSVFTEDNKTIFFQKDAKDFTILQKNGDVLYAKEALQTPSGVELCFATKFHHGESGYEKQLQSPLLPMQTNSSVVFGKTKLKTCDSISKFYRAMKKSDQIKDVEKEKITSLLFYKCFFPFMHLFCYGCALLIGFHPFFRKKIFASLAFTLFSFLSIFYYIESTYILSFSNRLPLYFFIIPLLFIPSFTLTVSFLKKV